MPRILHSIANNVTATDDDNPLVTRILDHLSPIAGNDSHDTSINLSTCQKSNDINDEHLKFPVKNTIINKNYSGHINCSGISKQLKERLPQLKTLFNFNDYNKEKIEILKRFPFRSLPNPTMGNIFPGEEQLQKNAPIKIQKFQKALPLKEENERQAEKFPVNEYQSKDKFPLRKINEQSYREESREFRSIANSAHTQSTIHGLSLHENLLLEFAISEAFPCKQNTLPSIDKYPIKDNAYHSSSPIVNAKKNVKRSGRKHLKPTHSLPANKWKIRKSVSLVPTPQMTHNYNELMAQVQNAQDHVENSQTLASSSSNQSCGRVIEDNVGIRMVPAGTSKNTRQKPEVQQNFENIERTGDDVYGYADRERKLSLSARNMNRMNNESLVDRKEEQRTTPPLSVTSVCYGKSNTNELLDDLDGVYNDPVVLVSSDVRDTCTLAVENGTNRNGQRNTGSALSIIYETPTFTSSEYGGSISVTSQVHHRKNDELLTCSDDVFNLRVNEKQKHEIAFENLFKEQVDTNEVLVNLSKKNKENFVDENINKLAKYDSLSDEMKYEMKGAKGALPNNARVPIGKPIETAAINAELRALSSSAQRSSVGGNISVDLSRFPANATRNELLNDNILQNRSISLNNNLESVLPEKTRLRRQRRSKNDDEPPEDPIERLNRLKARISGALSEVKGVLKQYSNDNEEEQTDPQSPKPSIILGTPPESKSEGPVHFRFVKKIRRRSLFLDEETDSSKEEIKDVNVQAAKTNRYETEEVPLNESKTTTLPMGIQEDNKDDRTSIEDHSNLISEAIELNKELSKVQDSNTIYKELEDVPKMVEVNLDTNSYSKKVDESQAFVGKGYHETEHKFHKGNEKFEGKQTSANLGTRAIAIPAKNSNLMVKETDSTKTANPPYQASFEEFPKSTQTSFDAPTKAATDITEINQSSKESNRMSTVKSQCTGKELNAEVSRRDQNEVNDKEKPDKIQKLEDISNRAAKSTQASEKEQISHSLYTLKEEDRESVKCTNGEICKAQKPQESVDGSKSKVKKKLVNKQKEGGRRASIAAVESSKIDSPIAIALPGKIKRRPSDSATVIKKKTVPSKMTTPDTGEEVTNKSKVVKVKRVSAPSRRCNEKGEQPVTHQTITTDEASTQIDINNAKKINDENHSLPNANTAVERPPLNEVITNEVKTLPTQLEIERRTASLSPLSAKEKLEATNAATTATTTTSRATNDSPDMLATVPEITRAMKSSIQTRESTNTVTTDFHDLLISESTVIITSKKAEDVVGRLQTGKATDEINDDHQEIYAEKPQEISNKLTQQSKQSEQVVVAINKNANNDVITSANVTQRQLPKPNVAFIEKKITSCTEEEIHEQQQQQHQQQQQQFTTTTDITKTIECPQISNSRQKITQQDTTSQEGEETTAEAAAAAAAKELTKDSKMPEQQLAPTPVQTAEIQAEPADHKKKVIHKKIIHQVSSSSDKISINKTSEEDLNKNDEVITSSAEFPADESSVEMKCESFGDGDQSDQNLEDNEELQPLAAEIAEKRKKERKIKKKVIIKRQQRRLSVTDSFFQRPNNEEQIVSAETETLEKPIAYVTDDEDEDDDKIEEAQIIEEPKPLKSCMKVKAYEIGDEVLYAERYKKTQIKWRRGKVKERITSISYLIDIDGKDVSSHVNYLKKYTNRKVKFGGKEYLEIDYEQLAEEEERAENLRKRTFSIWNMV
uniref:Uncharacterized protein n=1 Tax=Glossina pallidipes TaxID=7398 RepID=A0A1B0AEU7_GLOPL